MEARRGEARAAAQSSPDPLDPTFLKGTLKTIDKCIARMQELQGIVTGGNKEVARVDIGPQNIKGHLKSILRCKQESAMYSAEKEKIQKHVKKGTASSKRKVKFEEPSKHRPRTRQRTERPVTVVCKESPQKICSSAPSTVGENASGQAISSDGKNDAYDEVDDLIAKYAPPVVGGKKDDIGVCPAVDSKQTDSVSRHESKQGFCRGDNKYEEASSGPEWAKLLEIQMQQQTADSCRCTF